MFCAPHRRTSGKMPGRYRTTQTWRKRGGRQRPCCRAWESPPRLPLVWAPCTSLGDPSFCRLTAVTGISDLSVLKSSWWMDSCHTDAEPLSKCNTRGRKWSTVNIPRQNAVLHCVWYLYTFKKKKPAVNNSCYFAVALLILLLVPGCTALY